MATVEHQTERDQNLQHRSIFLCVVQIVEETITSASAGNGFFTILGGCWWTVDEHLERDGAIRVLQGFII